MISSPVGVTAFGGAQQFRQVIDFTDQCAAQRRPFAEAEDASDQLRWSSGPAGRRASIALDQAMRAAYRTRQVERVREAIDVFMSDNLDREDFDKFAEESLIDSA